ncbi:MAG: AarF/UbiB family protein, partial [Ghiorsea sp.]|nr:AarF/UbiB family protein [Ghiorsea sp.]
ALPILVFVYGYFHADLHPGNIFVAANGDIKLVDFGIVGRLDIQSRVYLADMMLAFLKQNYKRAAEVHIEAGYVPYDTDVSAFEDALREIAVPIFNRPLKDISIAELLFYLFAVTERFQMETQPQLLLLQKSMVVIEGVTRELYPDINIWELAKPLIADWAVEHLGPKGKVQRLVKDTQHAARSWMSLPEDINKHLASLEQKLHRPSKSSMALSILPTLLVLAGGITVGLLWHEPVHTYVWFLGWSAIVLGVWMSLKAK